MFKLDLVLVGFLFREALVHPASYALLLQHRPSHASTLILSWPVKTHENKLIMQPFCGISKINIILKSGGIITVKPW